MKCTEFVLGLNRYHEKEKQNTSFWSSSDLSLLENWFKKTAWQILGMLLLILQLGLLYYTAAGTFFELDCTLKQVLLYKEIKF